MPEIKPKEAEDQRLNDKFNNSETLNDKVVHAEKTLLDVHQSTKIGDITSAISLNQRFLFTNNQHSGI
ncbi:MAG: hypothetical protein MUF45_17055 [Spirosomaceae bacterium]|nr:hypothetical protein [Spirosomataceae bacterium]